MSSHQGGRRGGGGGLKFQIMLGSSEGGKEKKMQRCERQTWSRHLELNRSRTTTELFAPRCCEGSQKFKEETRRHEERRIARLSQSLND